jgi:uncharacterized cupredoxin-like copper-binding protein
MARRCLTALVLTAVMAGVACGSGGGHGGHSSASEGRPDRTVAVAMENFTFSPSSLTAKKGETVRFRFSNPTVFLHEAVVGDEAAQREHRRAMAEYGRHPHEGNYVEVAPGETEDLTYTFTEPGTLLIGCYEPGHYEAGMRATITVVA